MSDETRKFLGLPWTWFAIAGALIALMAAWALLPLDEWMRSFSDWIKELGALGVVLFALAYIVATVVMAPGSIFSLAAGVAYGVWGFPLVVVSATIGASLAFLVGRHLARDRVAKAVDKRPKFKAVDKAVSEDGWKVVMLMRLSPVVPFNLQNYFFGVTEVKFWHYAAATLVGILPGTALYVYLGSIGSASGGSGGALKWVFFGVGLIATIVVLVVVSRKAKEKLEDYGVEDDSDEEA